MSLLVVVAHGDDEALMAGGVIAKIVSEGRQANLLVFADGVSSRMRINATLKAGFEEAIKAREEMCRRSAEVLGMMNVRFMRYADQRLDGVNRLDLVHTIEAMMDACLPETIITHEPNDVNLDHRIVCDAVTTACRKWKGMLLYGEVVGNNTKFEPNCFVDVSDFCESKEMALSKYEDELSLDMQAASLGLLKLRGIQCGAPFAEAFMVGRIIG